MVSLLSDPHLFQNDKRQLVELQVIGIWCDSVLDLVLRGTLFGKELKTPNMGEGLQSQVRDLQRKLWLTAPFGLVSAL